MRRTFDSLPPKRYGAKVGVPFLVGCLASAGVLSVRAMDGAGNAPTDPADIITLIDVPMGPDLIAPVSASPTVVIEMGTPAQAVPIKIHSS